MTARHTLSEQFGGYQANEQPNEVSGSEGRMYLSRPGDPDDRVYFNDTTPETFDKMGNYMAKSKTIAGFVEQAYGAGYTNTRNWEQDSWMYGAKPGEPYWRDPKHGLVKASQKKS